MSKNKFFQLEVLRVAAIVLVFYDHSTPYLGWDARYDHFIKDPGAVGLGIFFMLSGFLLQRSRNLQSSDFNGVSFLKKRLTRILPLYWIAVVVFIIRFHYFSISENSSSFEPVLPTFVVHFLGLQLFFKPLISEIFTLWYIGALVPYYILFCITTKFNFRKYISLNLIVLAGFVVFKLVLQSRGINLIDVRLLLHYPTFLIGTIGAYFNQDLLGLEKNSFVRTLILGIAAFSYGPIIGNHYIHLGNNINLSVKVMAYFGYSLTWTLFFISLIFLIAPFLSRFSGIIQFISENSYALYLFHRPIYGTVYGLVITFISTSTSLRTLLFPVVTLLVIGLCYHVTQLDSKVLSKQFTKLANRLF